ncbi:hypothetical protein Goarm_016673 [Gossypium armourianum]|uniref:Uncharacterized protein n=1 Tax=Gossypium armourianum TaxID=34283 RepID=A0A7J9JCY0_9ROSI|nr:hypothetical protein [Gossypium armourianum]
MPIIIIIGRNLQLLLDVCTVILHVPKRSSLGPAISFQVHQLQWNVKKGLQGQVSCRK